MGLPNKFKYFNTFINGDNYIGQTTEVTLPKLTKKVESYRAGGMPGAVAVDMGFDDGALDLEVTYGGLMPDVLAAWGNAAADGVQLRFSGSAEAEDGSPPIPVEIQARGRFTELDPGAVKAGDDTSHKYTFKSTYLKWTVNGREVVEIDLLNMIYRVDGKDILEKHRANCGL